MLSIEYLAKWIGREEVCRGHADLTVLGCMHAMLDRPGPAPDQGDPLPWGWHWLWSFSLTPAPQSMLDGDGHPKRGGFLPPVPLPRRMWAGSRIQFGNAALRAGHAFEHKSVIADVQLKQGRTGTMVFVTVRHEWTGPDGLAITEDQDIVYREAAAPGAAAASASRPEDMARWSQTVEPSSSLLFRYSALTFNAHRIHYDRAYACDVEGYPGLVVHGPLQATLLLESLAREYPEADLAYYEFRGRSALCDTGDFKVCGTEHHDGKVRLWTESAEGNLATLASARWR